MKTTGYIAVLLLTAVLFAETVSANPSSYLPVTHRAYDYLERAEHMYLLTEAHLGTKPATRADIAEHLYSLAKSRRSFSDVDKEELDYLLTEFSSDYFTTVNSVWNGTQPTKKLPGILGKYFYRNYRNFYSARGDNFSLFIDPVVARKASFSSLHRSSKKDNVYTSGNGYIVRGTVGGHVGFHVDVRDSKEWGSRDYPKQFVTTMPGLGYATYKGDHAEFDETSAHINYTGGPFKVSYGRGSNIWGRGERGTLMISDYSAPYDQFRLEASFWRLKFMFIAAEIEQFPPLSKFYYSAPAGTVADSVAVKKMMSSHRVEINFTDRFTLGFHETVVYGGRWDMSYLNPVMFFKGAEHSNGDHDNAAMGMDFRYFVHRSHSIYGELLVDDITTTKLGTDWYGNKLAFQLGTYLVEPFGYRDTDIRLEYLRINPWVYTHRYPINSYTHYGDVLGHQSGPNSDDLFFEVRKRFTQRFHTSISVLRNRHGANTDINVGGNPLEGHQQGDPTKATFLAGNLEKSTVYGMNVSYELLWQLFVRGGWQHERLNSDGINVFHISVGLNDL